MSVRPHDAGFDRFLGRDAETTLLRDRLERARAGFGAAILLTGPPGIGKSRLIREFCKRSAVRIDRCASGGNLHREQTPYAPFREALGAAFLKGLFAARPARLVTIDDLQWADDRTLELVAEANRRIADLPMLLLCTLETAPFGRDEQRPAVANLMRGFTEVVALQPLAPADVRTLVKGVAAGRAALDADATARIEERCGGNPGYLLEMLRDAPAVPPAFLSFTERQIARLPEATLGALRIAAVLGTRFEGSLLARLTRRRGDTLVRTLQAACDLGVLVARSTDEYAFAHPLVREALYAELTPATRARTHAAAALTLERDGCAQNLEALSDHWFASNRPQRCVAYAERAAASADAAGDYAVAARHYERALGFAPEAGFPRAELCRKLALALYFAGMVSQSRRYFEEAATYFAGAGDPQTAAELLRFLATALWHDGDGSAALAVVEDALEHLARCGDSVATCHLLVKAAGLCDLMGLRDESVKLLARARAFPRRKPLALQVRYHNVRACCLAHQRRFSEAIAAFDTTLALLERRSCRDVPMYVTAAQNASACLRAAGRFAQAEARARGALEYARRRRAGPLLETSLALVHADLLATCGRVPEAVASVERSLENAPKFGVGRMELMAFGLPIAIAAARDDLADACFESSAVEAALTAHVSSWAGTVIAAAARLAHVRGDEAGARDLLRRGVRALDDAEFAEPLLLAVAEYGPRGELRRARALLASLKESAATPALLLLFDAFAARRSSNANGCRRPARAAATALQQLGAPLWAGRALELAGRQKLALQIYHRAGAIRDARRLESVFTGRGRKGAGPLTRRQIEIGRSIAAGNCNRTIASDLQISAKTLESHLTAMYRRLGVGRRADIARYVLENELGSAAADA